MTRKQRVGAWLCVYLALVTVFQLGMSPAFAGGWSAGPQRKSNAPFLAVPTSVEFRENDRLGLQVKTWVNRTGPFVFVIDTGAGMTLISKRTAAQARIPVGTRSTQIQGATGTQTVPVDQVTLQQLAIGGPDNQLPNRGRVGVVSYLPEGIDGILDPTEAFQPLGYVLDFPASRISAFDPRAENRSNRVISADGARVRWVNDPQGRRPFVRLNDRWNALIDTGVQFGLALPASLSGEFGARIATREAPQTIRDVNGGTITVHRVRPVTIQVESYELAHIPTDVMEQVHSDTPILLGRQALRPFRIRFDPTQKFIEFEPSRRGEF